MVKSEYSIKLQTQACTWGGEGVYSTCLHLALRYVMLECDCMSSSGT